MTINRPTSAVRCLQTDPMTEVRARWLLVALATALLAAAPLLRAEPWTLEQAVDTALKNSPDAHLARQRIAAAEAMTEQAGAAWLPQVMVRGGYTGTNNAMMAFGAILNQRAFNFGLDFNHPGAIDDLNATGTVAYNLYSGGRATAGRNAARAGAPPSRTCGRRRTSSASRWSGPTSTSARRARPSRPSRPG